MYKQKIKKNKGFTIVEAMVAIFILTVSVSSMLGITASSSASARYANNEITANYLLQEAIDSIRNSRDTIAFQMKAPNEVAGTAWKAFLGRYGSPNNKCFSPGGCFLSMNLFKTEDTTGFSDVSNCVLSCPYLKYDDTASHFFYNYTEGVDSEFKRTVNMKVNPDYPDEIEVTAKIDWTNGNATAPQTQTLTVYLLNWQK